MERLARLEWLASVASELSIEARVQYAYTPGGHIFAVAWSCLRVANFRELRLGEVRGTTLLPGPDRGRAADAEEARPAPEGELAHSFRNLGNLSMGVAQNLTPGRLGAPGGRRRPAR
jgi:hypothetical protein